MHTLRRPLVSAPVPVLATLLVAAFGAACNAFDSESLSSGAYSTGAGGVSGTSGGGGMGILSPAGGAGGGPAALRYSQHCGEGCLPGTAESASCDEVGAGGAGTGTGTGGGAMGGSGGSEPSECKLAADGPGAQGVCSASGSQGDGDACLDASDCLPGYGCVDTGVCRPYCCGDLEACPPSTFCELHPLAAMGLEPNAAPSIPVCVPAQPCELLADSCPQEDKVCTIVRIDGTTSCVEPGTGMLGDSCPCAEGYVCSTGLNTCFKLCRVDTPGDCPAQAPNCQGGATSYPSGFGVCVSN